MNPFEQHDSWASRLIDIKQTCKLDATLAICYTDRNGIKTKRTIDVREFAPYLDSHLIIAHCRVRNERRSFVANRITACADVERGEYIDDVDSYLLRRYRETLDYTVLWLQSACIDILKTLLYFGKASGALRTPKRVIIRDFCRDLAADQRLTDQAIDKLFKYLNVPSARGFKLAVGRLNDQPTLLKVALFCCMRQMQLTSKTAYAAEIEALSYVHKKWNL